MTARIKSETRTLIIPTTYENSEWDRAQTPNPHLQWEWTRRLIRRDRRQDTAGEHAATRAAHGNAPLGAQRSVWSRRQIPGFSRGIEETQCSR